MSVKEIWRQQSAVTRQDADQGLASFPSLGSGCTPILLPDKAGHGQVFLFGVEHNSQQVEPAHFILERKPAVAVFENSFSAGGGNGAVVSCTDSKSLDGSALVTMACATAARMQTSPGPVFQHVWQ
ncbi:hypothetical protein ABBQ32_006604 [Trebouxia sp. C0010 RCD-2024]